MLIACKSYSCKAEKDIDTYSGTDRVSCMNIHNSLVRNREGAENSGDVPVRRAPDCGLPRQQKMKMLGLISLDVTLWLQHMRCWHKTGTELAGSDIVTLTYIRADGINWDWASWPWHCDFNIRAASVRTTTQKTFLRVECSY